MFFQIILLLVVLLLTRAYVVSTNQSSKPSKRKEGDKCVLAVFLGSGGHTSEALMMISALDFSRYSPRVYIVSEGDTLSSAKAMALEQSKMPRSLISRSDELDDHKDFAILTIPRARRVHQPMWTVPPCFIRSCLACIYLVTITPLLKAGPLGTPFADLLILNGPGTCVPLCVAVAANKFLGLSHPKTIYVESYARVHSLSLSGKILRYLVDCFLVQWPSLISGSGREECRGFLV